MSNRDPCPWQGNNYRQSSAVPRVLIVGESHHGEKSEDPDITNRVVNERRNSLKHNQFFGIVEHIILGRKPLVYEVSRFWDDYGFLNYAPSIVTDGISSHASHFSGAQCRLRDFIRDTEPDLVCFFSAKAWELRPWGGPDWHNEVFGFEPRNLGGSVTLYPFKDRAVIMARFNHPRGLGAPLDVWHEWYKHVFTLADQARKSILQ